MRFKDDGHAHAHGFHLPPAVGDADGLAGGALPLGGDGGPCPDDVYTTLRRYDRRRRKTECAIIAGIDYLIIADGMRVLVVARRWCTIK